MARNTPISRVRSRTEANNVLMTLKTAIDQDTADIGRIIDVNAQHLESDEAGRSGKLDGIIGAFAEFALKALANDNALTRGHFAQRFLAVSSRRRQRAHAGG